MLAIPVRIGRIAVEPTIVAHSDDLMIVSLEPDGPAAKSGIFLGDVLLKLEGQAITDTDDVQSHLGADRVGRQIEADILRGGSAMTIKIVPGERPTGER